LAFCIRSLVEVPALQTTLLAGAAGEDNVIKWAHSCELAAPWEWLGRNDLLMTNGFTVPSSPAEQVEFVRQLHATGIAGVAIGDKLHSPPLSPQMLEEADRLGFPVLSTAYDVPFMAVAQAVAQANRHAEHERMTTTMRIYEIMRQGASQPATEILSRLGAELGAQLHIADGSGQPLLGLAAVGPALCEQVVAVSDERAGNLPAVVRVADGDRQALIVPVPASEFACLVVRPLREADPALSVLQHVAAVMAIEIQRGIARDENLRRLGAELLAHLIDRRIDAVSAAVRLSEFELSDQELMLLAIESGGPAADDEVHRLLRRSHTPHLLLNRSGVLYVLLAASAVPAVERRLLDRTVGASAPFSGLRESSDAAKECRWALEAARGKHLRLVRYGQQPPPFMPRTVAEAQAAADAVLGDLLAYDAEHGGDLLRSLREFLGANRSWQRAAGALDVHKQTLVYRMRRVEDLTGKRLDVTGDVAELWMALRAHDLLVDAGEPATVPKPE